VNTTRLRHLSHSSTLSQTLVSRPYRYDVNLATRPEPSSLYNSRLACLAMVHYIRFLKYPKLEIKRPWTSVKALVTVTTDLGDDFYRQEITLHATLIVPNTNTGWRTFVWKPGMRTLWVSFNDIPASSCRGGVRLLISSRRSVGPDEISLSNMPEVLSVRSQNFGFEHSHGGSMVERSLQIGGSVLHIYEESGESIARHIW